MLRCWKQNKAIVNQETSSISTAPFANSTPAEFLENNPVISEKVEGEQFRSLEKQGTVSPTTLRDLSIDLAPLEEYENALISRFEKEKRKDWKFENRFIHPNVSLDQEKEIRPAINFLGNWLGQPEQNFLILLGDLGMGKTTLTSYLAYTLAKISWRKKTSGV